MRLYYVDGDFMSRIEQGHISHPKEFLMDQRLEQWKEASVIKETHELAVMVDVPSINGNRNRNGIRRRKYY
jgi:hypothetical protein